MTVARIVQWPVLSARQLFGRGPLTQVSRGGAQWELDLREGIDFSIWLRGYFEPSTVATYRRLLRPGVTVLDVGANIGAHTMHLAIAAGPAGRVIAFEPAADTFDRLVKNIALNPHLGGRISVQRTMLLASRETPLPQEVVSSWPLLPRSQLDPIAPGRAQTTRGAAAARLDDALRSLGAITVDFMKLDVDGYELDVLQGAPRLLNESPPLILIELAPSHLDFIGRQVEDVLDLLATHRYRVETLRSGREVTSQTIAALRRSRASINALAIPREV
jgi:FkbM family methyltransferase